MPRNNANLINFLYNEYNIYMDLAKRSEENRDKYFRLYVSLITGLSAFMSTIFISALGFQSIERLALIIISATMFVLSLATYLVLFGGRIGNIKCLKRINLIRKRLCEISYGSTERVRHVFLPISTDKTNYDNLKSATLIMLYVVSLIMALSASIFFFSIYPFLFKLNSINTWDTILQIIVIPTVTLFALFILIVLCSLYYTESRDERELSRQ